MRRRILYVQHAGALGGSSMSLLYTLEALDRTRFEPVVACIRNSPAVLDLYRSAGVEALHWPGISTFEHTTASWHSLASPVAAARLLAQSARWRRSSAATRALVAHVHPDLVHLNSVVLGPCAVAVKQAGIPLVWHVRESPVHGHLGLRTRWIGRLLASTADEVIFISDHDREGWTAGDTGVVVPNYVRFDEFDRTQDRATARARLGLPLAAPIVLFFAGAPLKGFKVLMRAAPLVKAVLPDVRFVMPGSAILAPRGTAARVARKVLPWFGLGTSGQRLMRRIREQGLSETFMMLPFTRDVATHLAACDVLAFPSTVPHFARPIVEAGAMARPVVGSDLGGVAELVRDEVTGLLVPPGDPEALAAALLRVLREPGLGERLGAEGYVQALERFDAKRSVGRIQEIYERLTEGAPLHGRGAGRQDASRRGWPSPDSDRG